ncbi:hypothetical protein AB9B41_24025, partial [Klebsiella quasipneumoniae]
MDTLELIDVELKKSILSTRDYDATEIQNLLETVYDDIYECRDPDKIRNRITKLSNIFHAIGDNTAVVLLFVLMNKLTNINGIKLLKHSYINT